MFTVTPDLSTFINHDFCAEDANCNLFFHLLSNKCILANSIAQFINRYLRYPFMAGNKLFSNFTTYIASIVKYPYFILNIHFLPE